MPKSKIIKDLANNISSIEVTLNRIYLLANDIHNDDLKTWARKEIKGYTDKDQIPE